MAGGSSARTSTLSLVDAERRPASGASHRTRRRNASATNCIAAFSGDGLRPSWCRAAAHRFIPRVIGATRRSPARNDPLSHLAPIASPFALTHARGSLPWPAFTPSLQINDADPLRHLADVRFELYILTMKPVQSLTDIDELSEGSGLDLVPRIVAEWEEPEPESLLARFRARCEAIFERVDPIEAEIVRMFLARERSTIATARAFDEAGKGTIYPILAAAALLIGGRGAFRLVLACAISSAVSLAIYPLLKEFVRRERPIVFDSELETGIAPTDRFSWPSGHSITAIAFLVPFVIAGNPLAVLIAPFSLLVLWSRIALGHHYPTDVIGGAALGAVIAASASLVLGV